MSFTLAFFFSFYFLVLFCCISSESFDLGWPDLKLWIWKRCLSTITAKHKLLYQKRKKEKKKGRTSVDSAEARGDSVQPRAIDVLLDWRVARSRMSKSRICCRPGPNNSHPPPPPLWRPATQLTDVKPEREQSLCVCILEVASAATNTERGRGGTAELLLDPKQQRLWDTSACSATAALIMAETLTVCCLSMLGPTLPLTLLAISQTTEIVLPGRAGGFSMSL